MLQKQQPNDLCQHRSTAIA
jgi:hypothetical protein